MFMVIHYQMLTLLAREHMEANVSWCLTIANCFTLKYGLMDFPSIYFFSFAD